MLWSTDDLAKVHIAALLASAEHDRLVAAATRTTERRPPAPRAPGSWWRRLMGMPGHVLGPRPLGTST